MMPYDTRDPRMQIGTLFSKMMVVIILLTIIALFWLGPQSRNYETFGGRTPTTTFAE
ncbi:MAG: hypothetical protein K8F92_15495 [Hyphomicrobium sp.]|uniref:hypothetical protein n=1 Tax=Hyphomicrobium sp. TaxID=82 RepID=UPI0022CA38B4|nr:hypothetical protein [Hyphomicrobium sp.]MBZ0211034.1 hypothetical protein [Hyphomicrobium sp.]MCZ7594294.1 hypothetical protein [Hyphomicrobium sp.]